MGMDVHDVPSASKPAINPTTQGGVTLGHESFYSYLRLRLPLEVGMVVVCFKSFLFFDTSSSCTQTVEPGIYFSPHLLAPIRDSKHINHDILKKYESVGGVRIEDDIVIIAEGYKNLTTVRSDVEWIESVCSGEI
jgi:Xaa-Pro dipeptidase